MISDVQEHVMIAMSDSDMACFREIHLWHEIHMNPYYIIHQPANL